MRLWRSARRSPPLSIARLDGFALVRLIRAKALESQERSAQAQIPGRDSAGIASLGALMVDIAEVGSAITAWNQGNAAAFVTILKRCPNDGRAKSGFAIASANQCG